jgi:hypothetical protein
MSNISAKASARETYESKIDEARIRFANSPALLTILDPEADILEQINFVAILFTVTV